MSKFLGRLKRRFREAGTSAMVWLIKQRFATIPIYCQLGHDPKKLEPCWLHSVGYVFTPEGVHFHLRLHVRNVDHVPGEKMVRLRKVNYQDIQKEGGLYVYRKATDAKTDNSYSVPEHSSRSYFGGAGREGDL